MFNEYENALETFKQHIIHLQNKVREYQKIIRERDKLIARLKRDNSRLKSQYGKKNKEFVHDEFFKEPKSKSKSKKVKTRPPAYEVDVDLYQDDYEILKVKKKPTYAPQNPPMPPAQDYSSLAPPPVPSEVPPPLPSELFSPPPAEVYTPPPAEVYTPPPAEVYTPPPSQLTPTPQRPESMPPPSQFEPPHLPSTQAPPIPAPQASVSHVSTQPSQGFISKIKLNQYQGYTTGTLKRICPNCGAMGFAIKEVEDKTRLLLTNPQKIYAKKKLCTKCFFEF